MDDINVARVTYKKIGNCEFKFVFPSTIVQLPKKDKTRAIKTIKMLNKSVSVTNNFKCFFIITSLYSYSHQ